MEVIYAQDLHQSDLHKFPEPGPKKVIWASADPVKAQIFAVFSGIVAFSSGTYTTQQDGETKETRKVEVVTSRPLADEELDQTVYLYELCSEGFKYIEGSGEYASVSESIVPEKISEVTVREIIVEWKREGVVELREGEYQHPEGK